MNYLNLLIHPVKFFRQVSEREKVSMLIPIIIIVLISCLSGVVAGNMVATMSLPEEQLGMIKVVGIVSAIISGMIGLGAALAIKAGILHFILKKLGGAGSFKTAAYVIGLTYFPKIIQTILNIFFQKPIDLATVSQFDWVSFLGGIFSIFNLWQIALVIIGLSVIYGVSYKKTALCVIGLEVLAAVINLVISLLTVSSMSGISTTGMN